ncbi:MAG TPA: hypothetical protein ENN98_00730 [Desulfurivibrio alkaliphilus]|uniref:Uncharacterized protein n=1 Tax=Desulfurivibrio alkaliphilus TaxID=427923 RepID=A0A7C2TJS0_9BACT|nr:hypothetical protein [Desulfurivibrio alkaliphilus]
MLRLSCLLYFVLTGLSGYLYGLWPHLAPGVSAHGLIGVLGFGYTAFLHFLVTPQRYGPKASRLRNLLAVLSLLLVAGALAGSSTLLNGAALGYLLSTIFLGFGAGATANRREDRFLQTAALISILSWLYFLYSWNFSSVWQLEIRFSHILLALSFPLSLLLFSRYLDLLRVSTREAGLTLVVLVSGVLAMFTGMLLEWPRLETASAGVLLLLIVAYLLKAAVQRDILLVIAFGGLLLTGASGIWYVAVYGQDYSRTLLSAHAHLAHFAWAAYGIYHLLMNRAGYGAGRQAIFFTPLLLALAGLITWMLQPVDWLLTVSLLLFLTSGLCLPLTLLTKTSRQN